MVWFQCEDCGDNLKKPKLPGHFRSCSARKLSCIDCGEMFGQESVQSHTQCITEAEKYGPKGQGKALNGGGAKPNKDSKQQPDFDITVGLSKRFPWFCSLCNTKATSEQTLLLHAEGKKHRARARAIHAAKQQPEQPEESALDTKPTPENKQIEEPKLQDASRVNAEQNSSEAGKWNFVSGKTEANGKESQLEKDKLVESSSAKNESNMKINWKKLITSTLKSNDGVLKMRKLKKLVLKAIEELGRTDDEAKLSDMLDHKINSSSRFKVENKHVHLVAKD
ncbi:hypothetical protein L3X38_039855 [Prunus dulcis]|uniref:U1-type domain-containing protein n=1 Tax=Prunus dulcis TaxID=3755 RepID=A0AAD4VA37_PRUDU|nr:hypothetical protein L3X38_039855 [Prunus dulcis]